jgi:hypothetical protein
VRVWNRAGTLLLQRRLELWRGDHEVVWAPPARGHYRLRVDAQGPSGPRGAAARSVRVVLPRPHRHKRTHRHESATRRLAG